MRQREASIHSAVAGYLRGYFPGIIFRTDFAAGIKMSMGQAVRHKHMQSGRAYPDLFIAHPITYKVSLDTFNKTYVTACLYAGLFLELKREDATVYLKNGQLSTSVHIREQAAMLKKLESLGYCARFAVGFEEAVNLINWYLGGAKSEKL